MKSLDQHSLSLPCDRSSAGSIAGHADVISDGADGTNEIRRLGLGPKVWALGLGAPAGDREVRCCDSRITGWVSRRARFACWPGRQ